jgi:hypothetical protein
MTYRAMALGTMVSAALMAPPPAQAQSEPGKDDRDQAGYVTLVRPREHERVLLNVGFGYVPSFGRQFTDDAVTRLRDGRMARVTVDYDLRHALDLEAGAVVMLNSSWGVGLTVLKPRFEHGEITSTIGTGGPEFDDAMRKETAANFELTRVLFRRESQRDPFDPHTKRGTGYIIRVLGGPSWYHVEQDLYTFRTTSELEKHEGTGWGYHAGLDISMYTSIPGLGGPGVGFGTTLRYGRGSVKLPGLLDNEPSNRPAGGWNMAYTIRVRI